jgi:trimethylamine--corrinoid protein Co-methyltransferase
MSAAIRPLVKLLADDEPERIVGEACLVLARTGVLVEAAAARALLLAAGATARDDRLLLTERVVRDALARVPGPFLVYDRDGAVALDLRGDRVHFDPGSAAIHLLDPAAGRRRAVNSRDVMDFVRLVDGLPNYAAQSTGLVPADVPPELSDRYRLYLALTGSRKPVVTGTFRTDGFAPMRDMLAAVRGGAAALAARPLAIFDCCPSPPLKWSELTCQALIDAARAGIPAEIVSVPLCGATAPVTLREAVVQHCAETLSGVVIHQLARPGAPVVYGGSPAALDMRHGTTPMGGVETMLMDAAYAQVGKHLGLPTHGYLTLSDSKVPDYQAGFESGMGAVVAALAGINVVSGAGMLDFENCQSLEKVLLDHEIVGMALRLLRGVERRPGDSAALIEDLVHRSEFLSHPHTRASWRAELHVPSAVVDRQTYGDWESAGGAWAHERARAEVARRLAAAPPPPLDPAVGAALDAIILAEAERFGVAAPRTLLHPPR